MKGFDSNYLNTGDEYVVVEADEYDRSFLNLNPDYSVITSIEEDHLDVYHDLKEIYSSFNVFSDNTNKSVVAEKDLNIRKDVSFSIKDDADYSAKIIKNEQNGIYFNFKTKNTSSFPNALLASRRAVLIWFSNSDSFVITLIPRPPPPQEALSIIG